MKRVRYFYLMVFSLWPFAAPAQDLLLVTTLTTNWLIIDQPRGVAVDGAGNIYGSDGGASIWKFTPAGVLSTFAGNPTNGGYADGTGINARFFTPVGVALDRAGNLYVADSGNHMIRKVTPAGVVSTFTGQAGSGYLDGPKASARFTYPNYIAVDGPGNVYLTDDGNYAIRKIGTNGLVSTIAGSRWDSGYVDGWGTNALFIGPQGIAADNTASVYVADAGGLTSGNNVIRKLTVDGTGTNWLVSTLAGQAGVSGYADGEGTNAMFRNPWGVALDSAGNLYVADWDNELVREITTNGVVSTLAGYAWHKGTADGVGTNARFGGPMGIAVDSLGKVYVGDMGTHSLRLGVPYPVPVRVRLSAHQAVVSWPASAAGFVLETSGPTTDGPWTPLTTGIVTLGNGFFLTNPITSDAAFYRLNHP